MGLSTAEVVPTEVRAAEERRKLEAMVAHPAHRTVAHVQLSALAHLEAAEHALAAGEHLRALHVIGVAEGIAEALRAVAGGVEGLREVAVATTVARKAAEVKTLIARLSAEGRL